MAYTEIHPVKSTLRKALDYILDENKTDGRLLVSSFGCSPDTADLEFDFTLGQARRGGPNLAHHLVQSFAPGETTPEQAHEIGRQLADETLGGKYEYVLTTHIDKGHIHNHVIFCAASFVDHRKYVSNRKTLNAIRRTSDRLCRENGLTTIIPGRDDGKGSIEYSAPDGERRTRPARERGRTRAASGADKSDGSYRSRLRAAIDDAIPKAQDIDELLAILEADGYEVKRGKYISFRAPGQECPTRMKKTLGDDYTEQAVRQRIADAGRPGQQTKEIRDGTATARTIRPKEGESVSLLIDIEHSVKAQESGGYASWAKRFNLKQKAAALNYLTKHGVDTYDDLQRKHAGCAAAVEQARAAVKAVETKMSNLSVTMKNVNIVEKTKDTYAAYRRAKDRAQYRRAHEGDIILHEAAARALKAEGRPRPPAAALAKEYARLDRRKGKLYAGYRRAKRQFKEVDAVKRNLDSILKPPKKIERSIAKKHSQI